MFRHSFTRKIFTSIPNLNLFKTSFAKNFADKIIMKKDYYKILGVAKTSTEEEIKIAYRNLAKRYHPDVNIGEERHEPNIEKFRDIAEAYAVLSNKTMRLDYDMRMKTNSDIIYNSEKMKNMEENKMNRDSKGNQIKPGPMKGSYAEYRREKIKELRDQFNVNEHGMYKGGLPGQNSGQTRGTSLGVAGAFHHEWYHNELSHDLPHVRPHVTRFEAETHKKFMNLSRQNYQRFSPYYYMDEIEKDAQYDIDDEDRRIFWISVFVFLSIFSYYFYNRFDNYLTFRKIDKKIENLEVTDFLQIGPVLIAAPERKYMQKYMSREEYHDWIDYDLKSYS